MTESDPPQENGAPPPLRPAEELPLHPHYHRGGTAPAPAPAALNVIPVTQVAEGDVPWVALCPYCGADLSTVSLARYRRTPEGVTVDAFYPMRCPECRHPLLYAKTSQIVVAREVNRG